jgi:GLPGLI family protein
MKPFILFISFLLIFSSETTAQKKVAGIAVYEYRSNGLFPTYDTYLRFNEKGAWYSNHQEKDKKTTEQGYNLDIGKTYRDLYIRKDSVYLFVDIDKFPPFFGRWANKPVTWQITDETQKIAGFVARKAIGKPLFEEGFTGFEYGDAIAWFTTDVPLNYGPDGYYGLPGLIVKIEHPNKINGKPSSVSKSTLKSIEYKTVENWKIPSTNKKIEVTQAQAYNPWKLGEKWFQKKKKELGY